MHGASSGRTTNENGIDNSQHFSVFDVNSERFNASSSSQFQFNYRQRNGAGPSNSHQLSSSSNRGVRVEDEDLLMEVQEINLRQNRVDESPSSSDSRVSLNEDHRLHQNIPHLNNHRNGENDFQEDIA